MESCSCIHCTGDDFHREQMAQEFARKDDYMEKKAPSVYEKLQELYEILDNNQQYELAEGIMSAVNNIDTYLMEIALTCEDKKATEKILEVQYILY